MNEIPKMPLGSEQPEEKKEPTTLDLIQETARLKAKIEQAKADREKDTEQKVVDREKLIGEAQQNSQLLETAKSTLDYFSSMQELGDLTDPEDVKKIEELQALITSLEQNAADINAKIDTISARPEIQGKLYEAAEKEGLEREKLMKLLKMLVWSLNLK